MKHAEDGEDAIRTAAASLGVEISSSAAAKLLAFETLLRERAIPLGLVAASDAKRLRERHLLDCLRAVAVVHESDALAYDVGSGAGLPGLVVAIARAHLQARLVEPRQTRVAFLELAIERLELTNVSALRARIEDVRGPADLCFARAFAPLGRAWQVAAPLLRPGGRLVYFAGRRDLRRPSEIGELLSGVSDVDILDSPVLESGGPLIIMAR